MCLCVVYLVQKLHDNYSESKGRFFLQNESIENIRITYRIDSNRELECSSVDLLCVCVCVCVRACSMMYDKDAGHKVFMEDVYECESRLPGGVWSPAGIPWTDVVRTYTQYPYTHDSRQKCDRRKGNGKLGCRKIGQPEKIASEKRAGRKNGNKNNVRNKDNGKKRKNGNGKCG